MGVNADVALTWPHSVHSGIGTKHRQDIVRRLPLRRSRSVICALSGSSSLRGTAHADWRPAWREPATRLWRQLALRPERGPSRSLHRLHAHQQHARGLGSSPDERRGVRDKLPVDLLRSARQLYAKLPRVRGARRADQYWLRVHRRRPLRHQRQPDRRHAQHWRPAWREPTTRLWPQLALRPERGPSRSLHRLHAHQLDAGRWRRRRRRRRRRTSCTRESSALALTRSELLNASASCSPSKRAACKSGAPDMDQLGRR